MNLNTDLLLDPQKDHALKLVDSLFLNGVAADLSETGCGKTYVAAWVAKYFNVPIVVICPKVVIRTWNGVLDTFGIKAHTVINFEKLLRGTGMSEHVEITQRPRSQDEYDIKFPKNALIIVDEVHKCKAWDSKNAQFLIALRKQKYKTLVLSATAATNPLEMRSFGFATLLHNLHNFKDWILSKGAYRTGRFGTYGIDLNGPQTLNAMREMHEDLFENLKCASRMTRKQFGKIFPKNRIVADSFDMGSNTDKINKVYAMMDEELAQLEESSSNYSEHVFAIMTKARRMAELLKVPTMVEMIKDWYDEGISPVVFVNYTDTVKAIAKKLEKTKLANQLCFITGGQSQKQRNTDIDDFQSNKKRVMIANLAAGNAGISLHDLEGNHPRASVISPSFSAINLVQALGRIHRAEGKSECIQKIMFAADTIEERACSRCQSKINNIDNLNDGDLTSGINISR